MAIRKPNSEKLKKYRLNEQEYGEICKLLKREPNDIEWALFSALWSEHCSYKSSKIHLKKFYNKNPRVLISEGENSGIIDLGQDEKISFKMESHNHPSFIEPYQGAATGVGGILRDIFTMGARPIMLANYLCFGEMGATKMKSLVQGVVSGISSYGNCVGVPTVTGATELHSSYDKNILVNALALGVFYPGDPIALSKAQGGKNLVVYVGAKTGRDGIHGASMASQSFDENSESSRPTVQIGDPFFEKLLIESCLEVICQNLVVAIQDMGAAGLTSSSFEMSSKGGVGLKLHLDQVPLRDSTLTPEDILLSESQERMLLICDPQKLKAIQNVFQKWSLDATVIGEVTETKDVELYWRGDLLTKINPDILVENAPRYERPFKEKKSQNLGLINFNIFSLQETLEDILKSDQGTSRKWIYQQYDQRVGGQTARNCDHTIGVVCLEHSKRALGLALGCRPYLMRMDTRIGALDSVFYPALNLSVKGFTPLAVTDCLNFGSPENPETMGDFVASVESMSEACRLLDTPVISGNVSFYNQTLDQDITPTPATGVVGIRENIKNIPEDFILKENLGIYLVYHHELTTGGALEELYKKSIHANKLKMDTNRVANWIQKIQNVSNHESVLGSKTVGKFGFLTTLIKMTTEVGVVIEKLPDFIKSQDDLFLERLYEVLYIVRNEKTFEEELYKNEIQFVRLGYSKKDTFEIFNNKLEKLDFKKLKEIYKESFNL